MKREIKFRAWLKRSQEMYQVEILDFEKNQAFIFTDDFDLWADFDEIELMQFTGVYDKNGKEIYEGDIIRRTIYVRDMSNSFIEEVVFDNGCFLSKGKGENNYTELANILFHKIEIIGNIHDNIELLEKIF